MPGDRTGPGLATGPESKNNGNHSLAVIADETAYARVCDALRDAGKTVRRTGRDQAIAQCPAHDDHHASLTIWRKPGRAKIKCFVGCDDAHDILPALGLGVADLFDVPGRSRGPVRTDPEVQARIERRRIMGPVERAVDDLLQRPDIGMRLCLCIAAEEARRANG